MNMFLNTKLIKFFFNKKIIGPKYLFLDQKNILSNVILEPNFFQIQRFFGQNGLGPIFILDQKYF